METKVCANCGKVEKRGYMNMTDGGWLCDVCYERGYTIMSADNSDDE